MKYSVRVALIEHRAEHCVPYPVGLAGRELGVQYAVANHLPSSGVHGTRPAAASNLFKTSFAAFGSYLSGEWVFSH